MPTRPMQPCRKHGCKGYAVEGGYCKDHQHLAKPFASIEDRPSAFKRGYDRRWQQVRRIFLRQHPLCVECGKDGRTTLATEVDHIVPHRGDRDLFWDQNNWQPLCKRCHTKKTAKETQGGSF